MIEKATAGNFTDKVTYLNRTPMSGMWFGVVQECLEQIGLCAQNMIIILSSKINIIGGDLFNHVMSTRIFTLVIHNIVI